MSAPSLPIFRVISRILPSIKQSQPYVSADGSSLLLQPLAISEDPTRVPTTDKLTSPDSNSSSSSTQRFTYDAISASSTQNSFFDQYIKPLVQTVIDGGNASETKIKNIKDNPNLTEDLIKTYLKKAKPNDEITIKLRRDEIGGELFDKGKSYVKKYFLELYYEYS